MDRPRPRGRPGWLTTACTSNSASGDAAASRSASSADAATSGVPRNTRRRRATEAEANAAAAGRAPDARAVTAPRRFEATRGDETASRAVARVDDDDENEHDPRVRKIRPRLAGATRRVAAAA